MDTPAREEIVVRTPGARTREVTVPREVRSRVNRLAHYLGQRHEEQVKAALLADLERIASTGAGLADLLGAMDRHDKQEGLAP